MALVGNKFGAPIGPDLEIEGNPFNGGIKGVQIDLEKPDADHMVSDAERWRVAMYGKLPGHGIDDIEFLQPSRSMSAIGG